MRRAAQQWLWLLVVVGGLGAVLILRKSESDRIREDLESIAEAIRFEDGTHRPTWATTLRACLQLHVSDPVTVSVPPIGEVNYAIDSLLGDLQGYAAMHHGLTLDLRHLAVKIDPDGRRATAKGEAMLDVIEPDGEHRGEPRRFSVTLQKNTDRWLVVHLQISSPRIDQPEARP